MVVSPGTVLDLDLRTHVHAPVAVLFHLDGLDRNVWGVRMMEDGSCEPFPALDRVGFFPAGGDWMKRLVT